MTNSKVRNSDSVYSICFSQVLLELFTFLINTADKEIYIFNSFLFPNTLLLTGQTHIHTNTHKNKHKSSFNNMDSSIATLLQRIVVNKWHIIFSTSRIMH